MNLIRIRLSALLVLASCLGAGLNGSTDERALTPVNPQASLEARNVLAYLQSIQGRQTLAGHHVIYGPAAERELSYIIDTTGKHPALIEFEAGIFTEKYGTAYAAGQEQLVEAAKRYWREGGLIGICWHWGNPLEPRNTYPNTKQPFDIEAALREGTPEHAALLRDLEVTAEMLKTLRDAGVPVLWRPLHEMCGGWFWWSMQGRETAQRLWRFIHAYFTEVHQLNNLLWVYSASHDLRVDWFPGLAYVDILGVDIYREGQQDERAHYDRLAGIAGGKPIVLSECDILPDAEVMHERGFAWGWVSTWHGRYVRKNSPEDLRRFYGSPRVITRDELPDFDADPESSTTSGSALIIDSQGRTVRLTFEPARQASEADGWFARMEAYDRERSAARARDEALRLQWIADEQERLQAEAEARSDQQVPSRQGLNAGGVIWLGGGGSRHARPDRYHRRSSPRPAPSPLRPIFLPTPNLTSPFPRSQPEALPGSNKSFLP